MQSTIDKMIIPSELNYLRQPQLSQACGLPEQSILPHIEKCRQRAHGGVLDGFRTMASARSCFYRHQTPLQIIPCHCQGSCSLTAACSRSAGPTRSHRSG
jgi:hypothetical protein